MASVLNRETFQYLKSVNTPDYPTEDWIHNPDLSAVAGVDKKYWKLSGDSVLPLTGGEKDAIHLDTIKRAKMDIIDSRTQELISQGFEYPPSSGDYFSLSDAMQRNLSGLNQVKDHPAVTYPLDWNHRDNSGKTSLADASEVAALYLTALGTVRAHRDTGTALKDSVRAATTVDAVEAITDNR